MGRYDLETLVSALELVRALLSVGGMKRFVFAILLASTPALAHAQGAGEAASSTTAPAQPAVPAKETPPPAAASKPASRPARDAASAKTPCCKMPAISLGKDWKLKIDGQYRPRVFGHMGRDFQDGLHPFFVTQRARVGFTASHSSGVSITTRLQDVRIWGEEANTLNDFSAGGFDVHEAFATLSLGKPFKLRIGRQEIIVGNHRLIGNVGWTQRARSFDGLRLLTSFGKFHSDIFVAKVRERDQDPDGTVPGGRMFDLDLVGVNLKYGFAPSSYAVLTYLFNGNYAADDKRSTIGADVWGKVTNLNYRVEFYYQRGGGDTSGILFAAQVGYTLGSTPLKPKFTVWGEILDGDFNTLYATNHKFYGELDLFLNIPAHTLGLGLIDIGGQAALLDLKPFRFHIDFHHFRSMDSGPAGEGAFGSEIDFKLVSTLR